MKGNIELSCIYILFTFHGINFLHVSIKFVTRARLDTWAWAYQFLPS
jgi:hypothetical protein